MALRISIIVIVVVLSQWYALGTIARRLIFKTKRSRIMAGIALAVLLGLINIGFLELRFRSDWIESGSPGDKYVSVAYFTFVGLCLSLSLIFIILDTANILWLGLKKLRSSISFSSPELPEPVPSIGTASSDLIPESMAVPGDIMPRRTFLQTTTAAAVVSVGGLSTAGVASAYSDPQITEFNLEHHRLKGLKEPLSIIHVTDFHIGSLFNFDNLERLILALNDVKGDMLVITGDIFHSRRTNVRKSIPVLRKLRPRKHGTYAVMGNHDFYTGEKISVGALLESGISVIRNAWKPLRVDGCVIHLGGVDDPATNWLTGTEFPHFPHLISHKPKGDGFGLLLSHRPNILPLAAENDIDLVLAGHVHGGQVVLPAPGERAGLSLADFISDYISGWYTEGRCRMYLNRGIGLTFIPWRVNCPPEITVLRLQPFERQNAPRA